MSAEDWSFPEARFLAYVLAHVGDNGAPLFTVMNAGQEPFTIERGMRIAQAVIAPVVRAAWQEVDVLPETARGVGGFGSTGTR